MTLVGADDALGGNPGGTSRFAGGGSLKVSSLILFPMMSTASVRAPIYVCMSTAQSRVIFSRELKYVTIQSGFESSSRGTIGGAKANLHTKYLGRYWHDEIMDVVEQRLVETAEHREMMVEPLACQPVD